MIAWSFIIVFLGMSRSNLSLPRYAHDIIKPDKQYGACKPSHLWLNQLFIRENTKSQLLQSKPHLSLKKTSHRWTFVNSFTLVNAFNRWCIRIHIWIKFFPREPNYAITAGTFIDIRKTNTTRKDDNIIHWNILFFASWLKKLFVIISIFYLFFFYKILTIKKQFSPFSILRNN